MSARRVAGLVGVGALLSPLAVGGVWLGLLRRGSSAVRRPPLFWVDATGRSLARERVYTSRARWSYPPVETAGWSFEVLPDYRTVRARDEWGRTMWVSDVIGDYESKWGPASEEFGYGFLHGAWGFCEKRNEPRQIWVSIGRGDLQLECVTGRIVGSSSQD